MLRNNELKILLEDGQIDKIKESLPLPERLTPDKLRAYGGKFTNMTDKQAWDYIDTVESFCIMTYKLFSSS